MIFLQEVKTTSEWHNIKEDGWKALWERMDGQAYRFDKHTSAATGELRVVHQFTHLPYDLWAKSVEYVPLNVVSMMNVMLAEYKVSYAIRVIHNPKKDKDVITRVYHQVNWDRDDDLRSFHLTLHDSVGRGGDKVLADVSILNNGVIRHLQTVSLDVTVGGKDTPPVKSIMDEIDAALDNIRSPW